LFKNCSEIGEEVIDCYITYVRDGLFKMSCKGKHYVVNLIRRTSGCRQWDLT
jgi:hypothetical protein